MFSLFSCFDRSRTTVVIKKMDDFVNREFKSNLNQKEELKKCVKEKEEIKQELQVAKKYTKELEDYILELDQEWEIEFNLEKSWNKFIQDLKREESFEKLQKFIKTQTNIFSFYYMIFPQKYVFYIITKKAVFVYKDGAITLLYTFWDELQKHSTCHIIYSYTQYPFIGENEADIEKLEKMFENVYSIF